MELRSGNGGRFPVILLAGLKSLNPQYLYQHPPSSFFSSLLPLGHVPPLLARYDYYAPIATKLQKQVGWLEGRDACAGGVVPSWRERVETQNDTLSTVSELKS